MKQPRLALIEDMPRVLELIEELATFEKEEDAVEITVLDLQNDGFGTNPKFTCFVSEIDNKIEGIALVYMRYSTWKGEILHLEDLIVSEECRGKGLGTLLLNAVVKYAKQLDVKRVSWEVLDWNEPAISFYESKGADVKRDWNVVHLDKNGIENYLNRI
ncbi:GNAT family N-acetyltransferase [Winogradskyella costae]|uniref:GNAT family N-acetyltransferase n=1 Tax=Winogradskyella costae TaxID=2697008 RepID=UPI0015CE784B|nr:GNAT family N-acetyltransferase [Winogradskyella costae]